eukprot:361935-Chlamydomonas_euryale.AAC.13
MPEMVHNTARVQTARTALQSARPLNSKLVWRFKEDWRLQLPGRNCLGATICLLYAFGGLLAVHGHATIATTNMCNTTWQDIAHLWQDKPLEDGIDGRVCVFTVGGVQAQTMAHHKCHNCRAGQLLQVARQHSKVGGRPRTG